jgi:hypothetical protein
MATTVIVTPRFQTAAKKLPVADSRILGEFLRLVVVMGANPLGAATTAHAQTRPLQPADKALAFGGTTELIISAHNRAFFKLSGPAVTLTNLVPVPAA